MRIALACLLLAITYVLTSCGAGGTSLSDSCDQAEAVLREADIGDLGAVADQFSEIASAGDEETRKIFDPAVSAFRDLAANGNEGINPEFKAAFDDLSQACGIPDL